MHYAIPVKKAHEWLLELHISQLDTGLGSLYTIPGAKEEP